MSPTVRARRGEAPSRSTRRRFRHGLLACLAALSAAAASAQEGTATPSPAQQPPDLVLGRSGRADTELQAGSVQRVTALLGAQVFADADGREVGPLEDFALDSGHDTALFALLGAGRYVGREDRLFPVPLETLSPRAAPETGGGPRLLLVHLSRPQLAMAPQAYREHWPGDDDPMDAALWSAAVWTHYGMSPYWNTAIPEEPRRTTDRQGRPLDPPPPPPAPFVKSGPDLVMLRLSTVLSAPVTTPEGDARLGRLVDVLLDLSRSKILVGIVARDDADGGETLLAVPWTALQPRAAGTRFALDMPPEAWHGAPGFAPDAWPPLRDTNWAALARQSVPAAADDARR